MTREEFVESLRHEIGGMVLDAATAQRTGADLALSLRFVMKRIDTVLAKAYDRVVPKAEAKPEAEAKPAEISAAPKPGTIPMRRTS